MILYSNAFVETQLSIIHTFLLKIFTFNMIQSEESPFIYRNTAVILKKLDNFSVFPLVK